MRNAFSIENRKEYIKNMEITAYRPASDLVARVDALI